MSLAAISALSQSSPRPGIGLGEAFAVWALLAFFAGAILWTYARLDAWHFFHVSTSGPSGGAGRALTYLNFPVALLAIPIAVIAADVLGTTLARVAAGIAIALSAVVAWPGVVDQLDLDARWINAVPAAGVALAFALTVAAATRERAAFARRAPGDRARLVLGALIVLFALHYVTGEFGIFWSRIPAVGDVFFTEQPWAAFGQANVRPAVHLGHHHGFDGALIALSALVLSRPVAALRGRTARAFLAFYLALMLAYGIANEVQDDWGEQLVKRGWVDWSIPSVLVPAATPEFLALAAAGAALYVLLFRRVARARRIEPVRLATAAPATVGVAAVAFATLGLTASGKTVRSPAPTPAERRALAAEGAIVFPMVDDSYDVFVMGGDGQRLHRVTSGGTRDLAPTVAAAGRRVAFQRQSDSNAKPDLYVLEPERGLRKLAADPAREGEPTWSPDGSALAFVRGGDLYVLSRARVRRVTRSRGDDEWPAWSPDGRSLVYQSDRGGDFDLYVVAAHGGRPRRVTRLAGDERSPAWSRAGIAFTSDRDGDDDVYLLRGGSVHRLTDDPGSDVAPAWSRDGRFLVFTSDRDGRDQIFVVRADGSGLARLTGRQADKDAADWGTTR